MEAEYVATSKTAKSIVWMDQLLKDLSVISNEKKSTLYIDNQSAIKLIGIPEFHYRSKHIESRYHIVQQLLAEKKISIQYILTEDQIANVFTKGL